MKHTLFFVMKYSFIYVGDLRLSWEFFFWIPRGPNLSQAFLQNFCPIEFALFITAFHRYCPTSSSSHGAVCPFHAAASSCSFIATRHRTPWSDLFMHTRICVWKVRARRYFMNCTVFMSCCAIAQLSIHTSTRFCNLAQGMCPCFYCFRAVSLHIHCTFWRIASPFRAIHPTLPCDPENPPEVTNCRIFNRTVLFHLLFGKNVHLSCFFHRK